MKWNGETLTVVLARTKANQRDFLSSVLIRIHDRVHKWEELGKMRSLVKQTEIKLGLDESYRELRTCSMRFNVRHPFLFSL